MHNGTCTESRLDDYKNQASRREEFDTVEKTYWWILNVDLISARIFWNSYRAEWMAKIIHSLVCGISNE